MFGCLVEQKTVIAICLMLFLASDAANHITGTEVWIDGGSSLVEG